MTDDRGGLKHVVEEIWAEGAEMKADQNQRRRQTIKRAGPRVKQNETAGPSK